MSSGLFAYPQQAALNRVLPKSKIYGYANPSRSVRQSFVDEVEQIVWKYKLAPETINLPPRPGVPEIQVFEIAVRGDELNQAVLHTIDKVISFPIFFEVMRGDRVQCVASYKRPNEADPSKWVVDTYFESEWHRSQPVRESLPLALDLASLYEQMLRRLIRIPARSGETLKALVERIGLIRSKQNEAKKLEARLRQEKQFNRKVEINRQLRELNEELNSLLG